MKIVIINGVNMDLLGTHPYELNGQISLNDIEKHLTNIANEMQIELEFFQSNIEGEIVNKINSLKTSMPHGILLNLGVYSQTSEAIADSLIRAQLPCVELMMNNIAHVNPNNKIRSKILPFCLGIISGFGPFVFQLGILALTEAIRELQNRQEQERS